MDAASTSLSRAVGDYDRIWKQGGLPAPVEEMRDYVTVAIEGNGNLTAAHRETGHLVLFAPDHAFEGVTPLAGCPEHSVYTFDELPDLASWIKACAGAWEAAVS